MLGAIIGDIVGSRFEFNNHRSKEFDLFTEDSCVTDDSIMTLAIAKAIIDARKCHPIALGESDEADFLNTLRHMTIQHMQKIGRRYPNCGFGGMFSGWVSSDKPEPYNSFGNGAAMRVSPAGFVAYSGENARETAKAVTEVTHNHDEGIKGAQAVAVAAYLARHGALKSEIREHIVSNYYPLDFTIDQIRDGYPFDETCQETVPQAIECFLESTSFEDAIRVAISLGGDSDTIAAITGSIAEAYYGVPAAIRDEALNYLDADLRAIYDEWTAFIGVDDEKCKMLTKYIGKIMASESFGEWVVDRENDGTPEHPIQWPFVNYSGLVSAFETEFYQFHHVHPEYSLAEYTKILEKNGLKWDVDEMCAADIQSLDEQCILALIMGAVRAEHFSDGVLLGFFKDGSIEKWLKRLKDIDWQREWRQPVDIRLRIGGYGGYQTHLLVLDDHGGYLNTFPWRTPEEEKRYTADEVKKLRRTFESLHVEYWMSHYAPMREVVTDGESWELHVKYDDGRFLTFAGYISYPENWNDLLDLFEIEHDDKDYDEDDYDYEDEEIRLKRFCITLERQNPFDAQGMEHGAHSNYSESWQLDHEKEQLIIKQNVGTNCAVTHQYDVQSGMDWVFRSVQWCLESNDWNDTEKFDDDTGARFFDLTAEYYNGTIVHHQGIYNRVGMPEALWIDLIDTIHNFIRFYGYGEMLDKGYFLRARKPDEIKYCSVSFYDGGDTYYYQTDDDTIEIGDSVIIPVGATNAESIGIVEEIDFFLSEDVPFPLEKTKSIIRKK